MTTGMTQRRCPAYLSLSFRVKCAILARSPGPPGQSGSLLAEPYAITTGDCSKEKKVR